MKNKEITSLRYFSSNKLIVLTSNKVASRYCSNFFRNGSSDNFEGLIQITPDFNLETVETPRMFSECYEMKPSDAENKIKKEWKSLLDNTNKKDILILYRDPLERTTSGIVQEFGVDIDRIKNNFITKLFFETKYSSDIYNNFISSYFFGISKDDTLFDIYKSLLLKYIENSSSFLIEKGHIKPYLIYLYDFILNSNIDKNKLKIVDIESKEVDLDKIFSLYELEKNTKQTKKHQMASNYVFKDEISYLFEDDNIKLDHNLQTAIQSIKNIVNIENVFYKKLKDLDLNIK